MPPRDRARSPRVKRSNACAVQGRVEARALGRGRAARHAVAGRLGRQLDCAVAVTKRVVNEVRERLLGREAVGVALRAVRARHAQLARRLRRRARSKRRAVVGEQLAGVEPLRPHGQPALVGAGEHQQVLGELDEPVALAGRRGRPRRAAPPRERPSRSASSSSARSSASGVRSSWLALATKPRSRSAQRSSRSSISFSVPPRRASSSRPPAPAGAARSRAARSPPPRRASRSPAAARRWQRRRPPSAASSSAIGGRSAARARARPSASSRSSRVAPTTTTRVPAGRARQAQALIEARRRRSCR